MDIISRKGIIARERQDNKMRVEQIIKYIKSGDLRAITEFLKHNSSEHRILHEYSHRKSGDNVLSYVCRQGNVKMLTMLHCDCGLALDLELCNFEGKRPLHEASQFGHLEIVEYLLQNGVSVDCIKRADWTPLMLACTKTNKQIIEKLILAGANPSLENKDGWTPFHLACREGDLSIVDYLYSVNSQTAETVSKNGRTPLHTAALHGRNDVVKYLIEKCDYVADVKDSCGSTPFMDAIRAGFTATADSILTLHKVDVSKTDNLGKQALHLAAESDNKDTVLYLLSQREIPVNVKTTVSQVTPLHLACKEGHWSIVGLLLQKGADLTLKDHKGRTALHIASGSQHPKCVEKLLEENAQDSPDKTGTYARDLAQIHEITQLFIKFGQG